VQSDKPQPDRQNVQGSGDCELKLQSSRCDLHPLYPLRDAATQIISSAPIKAPGCTKAGCNRHYCPEQGYFNLVAGVASSLEECEVERSCELNHERRYMVVTKIEGRFVWACPEAGCLHSIPYAEPEPANYLSGAERSRSL